MKEQYQLKDIVRRYVRLHRIFPKHVCGRLSGTLRSLGAAPALARRCDRIKRRKPISKGKVANVSIKAANPASPGRSARASRRFVSKSWVEIVLAGVKSFVILVTTIIIGPG